jgi:hypothetical protein
VVRNVVVLRVLPAVVACALAAIAIAAGVQASAAGGGPSRLPDLDQLAPTDLVLTRAGTDAKPQYRLGFTSAVSNVGDGPLIINGTRGPDTQTMVADQVVRERGGTEHVVKGVGRLRYVVSPDHRHWHLLRFDRYELRRAGAGKALVRDRKTGFCLGDRYLDQRRPYRHAAKRARYTSRCGLDHPEFLGITEGISVGYGDNYAANLEGQYLPVTGLPSGRYVLVHRANAGRELRELDYTNNAASLLLALRWSGGEPEIRVLRTCPDTDRCDRVSPRSGSAARGG